MRGRGTRWEVATAGFDADLQAVGSGPAGAPYYQGIGIPATPAAGGQRYLFNLALARIAAGRRGRVVGLRQLLTLIAYVSNGLEGNNEAFYPVQRVIESPLWRPVNGNVSWHLMRVGGHPSSLRRENAFNAEGLQFQYSDVPTLLFQRAPADVSYLPPNGGKPWGHALVPALSCFWDLRFPWGQQMPGQALDIEFQGPCDIVLFASVLQTGVGGRVTPDFGDPPDIPESLPVEDKFLIDFPTAVYGRIAGSIILETEDYYPMLEKTARCPSDDECLPPGWVKTEIVDDGRGGIFVSNPGPPSGFVPGPGGTFVPGEGGGSSGDGGFVPGEGGRSGDGGGEPGK